jgi:hypothetical protein
VADSLPEGCRFTHEGVVAEVRFQAQAVRHTRARMIGGVAALLAGMAVFVGLTLMGWWIPALALFLGAAGAIAVFALPRSGSLIGTPHLLRIGRVERSRSAGGRLEIRETQQEIVLSHHRDGSPREWWSIVPEHADRVRWFVRQVEANQAADAGSEEAVPEGLKAIARSRQTERRLARVRDPDC